MAYRHHTSSHADDDNAHFSIDIKADDSHQAPKVYTAIWADTDTDTLRARFLSSMQHHRMASRRRHRRHRAKRGSGNTWSIGPVLVVVLLVVSVAQLLFIVWMYRRLPRGIRSSGGQTTLQSFLFKPRVADGELNPYPPPPAAVAEDDEVPNSPPAPPKREIVRVTNKTIREKASAFSSVGSSGRRGADASALDAAVFKRFNGSSPPASRVGGGAAAAEAGGDADDGDGGVRLNVEDIAAGGHRWESRKRKSPFGGNEGRTSSNAGHVVVLGDDPKPRPPPATRTRGRGRLAGRGEGSRGLYNHYASGGGLWQGEQEGVDGEEVGWTEDMWEGMGSITLGGMEWH